MSEDRFESLLRDAARDYNRPPEPPREAMWARIQAERQQRESGRRNPVVRPWHWGIGMAAMLAIGIGIGRVTPTSSLPGSSSATIAADSLRTQSRAALPYRFAATQHLSRTEAFLTSYQSEARAGRTPRELSEWARDLLTGTRLLLDSPAAEDPRLNLLLQDLELVLAQIAQLAGAGNADDEVELIDEALDQRGTLSRLRAAVPAGPAPTGT